MSRFTKFAFAALFIILFAAPTGCGDKTTTVQMEERIEESDPEMVSPGKEIVE
jgi:hypothetical protein